MSSIKKQIRRFTRGWIPLMSEKIRGVETLRTPYLRYILNYGYDRHLFTFRHEYDNIDIKVHEDTGRDLLYVLTDSGRRLYFKRGMDRERVRRLYRTLLMEQDPRSPHRYFDALDVVNDKVFADIGCAEGFISLEIIDRVKHVCLFECDPMWIEALEATFEPWKDKVTIVRKFVGDADGGDYVTLDSYFKDRTASNLFLKMDIEGAERSAIAGGHRLFSSAGISYAVCAYHDDDTDVLPRLLDSLGCSYGKRTGYFRSKLRNVMLYSR